MEEKRLYFQYCFILAYNSEKWLRLRPGVSKPMWFTADTKARKAAFHSEPSSISGTFSGFNTSFATVISFLNPLALHVCQPVPRASN